MKKIVYSMMLLTMLSLSAMPALAQVVEETVCAEGETLIEGFCHPPFQIEEVDTGMTMSLPGGEAPVIKAKWEMNRYSMGADDSWKSGAQFTPPGEWGKYKEIMVCAVAMDPDGAPGPEGEDLTVYADIFYPTDKALGRCHKDWDGGCGQQHGLEIEMAAMSKLDGYDLLCNNIRRDNWNLVKFNEGYDYEEICNRDTGELMKETALVYCKYTDLKWEDPAGDYRVDVHAVDKAGARSNQLTNYFKYLPLTAFEVDFEKVAYGNVKLNTHKIVSGDLVFNPGDGKPTVRNVGNTQLNMTVKQDDMGLGKTENGTVSWNVRWDARVGSNAAFAVYEPYQRVTLDDVLGLSCVDEMDFSIEVFKFPYGTGIEGQYTGELWLGAVYADFMSCEKPV